MVRTRGQSRVAAEDEQQDRDRDVDPPAVESPRGDSHSPGSLTIPTGQDEYGSPTRIGRGPLSGLDMAPLEPSMGDISPRAYRGRSVEPAPLDIPEPSSRRAGKAPAVGPTPPPVAPYIPPQRRQSTPRQPTAPPQQRRQQQQPQPNQSGPTYP